MLQAATVLLLLVAAAQAEQTAPVAPAPALAAAAPLPRAAAKLAAAGDQCSSAASLDFFNSYYGPGALPACPASAPCEALGPQQGAADRACSACGGTYPPALVAAGSSPGATPQLCAAPSPTDGDWDFNCERPHLAPVLCLPAPPRQAVLTLRLVCPFDTPARPQARWPRPSHSTRPK